MSIVAVLVPFDGDIDVAEAENVQLNASGATSSIDGEQDGHGDETANEADGDRNLQVSKEEKTIERLVIEDVAVRDLVEGANPVEHSIGQVWCSLSDE